MKSQSTRIKMADLWMAKVNDRKNWQFKKFMEVQRIDAGEETPDKSELNSEGNRSQNRKE